jgi:hypothetical protein
MARRLIAASHGLIVFDVRHERSTVSPRSARAPLRRARSPTRSRP